MMFLPYFMASTFHAATLVNIMSVLQGLWVCIRYRKKVRWKRIFLPLCAYFVISSVTVFLSRNFSNDLMKILLGVFLLVLSAYFLLLKNRVRIRPIPRNALIAGSLGGVMSALFAIGGPAMSLYYSSLFDDKEEYLATIQTYFMCANTYILFLRYQSGLMTNEVFRYVLAALLGMALGTLLGKKVFDRINSDTVRKLSYYMMAFSGAVMIAETII